jgi:hypothetical protein
MLNVAKKHGAAVQYFPVRMQDILQSSMTVQASCNAVVCLLQHAVFTACPRAHHSCTVAVVLWSTRKQALMGPLHGLQSAVQVQAHADVVEYCSCGKGAAVEVQMRHWTFVKAK